MRIWQPALRRKLFPIFIEFGLQYPLQSLVVNITYCSFNIRVGTWQLHCHRLPNVFSCKKQLVMLLDSVNQIIHYHQIILMYCNFKHKFGSKIIVLFTAISCLPTVYSDQWIRSLAHSKKLIAYFHVAKLVGYSYACGKLVCKPCHSKVSSQQEQQPFTFWFVS